MKILLQNLAVNYVVKYTLKKSTRISKRFKKISAILCAEFQLDSKIIWMNLLQIVIFITFIDALFIYLLKTTKVISF